MSHALLTHRVSQATEPAMQQHDKFQLEESLELPGNTRQYPRTSYMQLDRLLQIPKHFLTGMLLQFPNVRIESRAKRIRHEGQRNPVFVANDQIIAGLDQLQAVQQLARTETKRSSMLLDGTEILETVLVNNLGPMPEEEVQSRIIRTAIFEKQPSQIEKIHWSAQILKQQRALGQNLVRQEVLVYLLDISNRTLEWYCKIELGDTSFLNPSKTLDQIKRFRQRRR